VRRAGRPSWEIIVDHPQVLAIALYIRDATGIVQHAPPAELPEALPPVARAGAASATTEETAEWNAWWSRALTTGPRALLELRPPSFPAFAEAPALHQLLQEHFEAARRWSDGPKRDHADRMRSDPPLLGKLVAAVERGLRRRAKPFTLRIDEVPVAGPTWLPVADGHVLVSPDLLRDPAAFFRELRPVIEELA
jgi:hypothetical protein